jgi:hypothetical protein
MLLKESKFADLPRWLQILWDMDSSLARQAETYIDELISSHIKKLKETDNKRKIILIKIKK